MHNETGVASIGSKIDLTYYHEHLGDDPNISQQIVNEQHEFSKKWKSATRPVIIVGVESLERQDGSAILSAVQALAVQTGCEDKEWKVLNVLHKVASQVTFELEL